MARFWEMNHHMATSKCYALGISTRIPFQQKSEDVSTSFDNTIENICLTADGIESTPHYMSVGDDSLLISSRPFDVMAYDNFHTMIGNIETKATNTLYSSFCGAF